MVSGRRPYSQSWWLVTGAFFEAIGDKVFSDECVLWSSEFVEKVIEDAEKKDQEYAGKSCKERHQENSLPNTRLNSVILMGLIK